MNRVVPTKKGRRLLNTDVCKLSDYRSESKFQETKKKCIQVSKPDIAYKPYHSEKVIRTLRLAQRQGLVIGKEQARVVFGSRVDLQREIRFGRRT